MAIIFKEPVKHGRHQFLPGTPVAFEDPTAEDYFVAAGWADKISAEPVVTFTADTVEIDPETVKAETGKKVLGGE